MSASSSYSSEFVVPISIRSKKQPRAFTLKINEEESLETPPIIFNSHIVSSSHKKCNNCFVALESLGSGFSSKEALKISAEDFRTIWKALNPTLTVEGQSVFHSKVSVNGSIVEESGDIVKKILKLSDVVRKTTPRHQGGNIQVSPFEETETWVHSTKGTLDVPRIAPDISAKVSTTPAPKDHIDNCLRVWYQIYSEFEVDFSDLAKTIHELQTLLKMMIGPKNSTYYQMNPVDNYSSLFSEKVKGEMKSHGISQQSTKAGPMNQEWAKLLKSCYLKQLQAKINSEWDDIHIVNFKPNSEKPQQSKHPLRYNVEQGFLFLRKCCDAGYGPQVSQPSTTPAAAWGASAGNQHSQQTHAPPHSQYGQPASQNSRPPGTTHPLQPHGRDQPRAQQQYPQFPQTASYTRQNSASDAKKSIQEAENCLEELKRRIFPMNSFAHFDLTGNNDIQNPYKNTNLEKKFAEFHKEQCLIKAGREQSFMDDLFKGVEPSWESFLEDRNNLEKYRSTSNYAKLRPDFNLQLKLRGISVIDVPFDSDLGKQLWHLFEKFHYTKWAQVAYRKMVMSKISQKLQEEFKRKKLDVSKSEFKREGSIDPATLAVVPASRGRISPAPQGKRRLSYSSPSQSPPPTSSSSAGGARSKSKENSTVGTGGASRKIPKRPKHEEPKGKR